MTSILLDTSFLISLADSGRPNHAVAKRYLTECLSRGVPLYMSTIVASEFQVKQAVNDLPLRNFIVLPFNIDHAMRTGILMRGFQRDDGDDRAAVKDDVKLIAQADCESISHVLTEDKNTLAKYLERLRQAGACNVRPIVLADGFDAAWLNGGQSELEH